MVEVGNANVNIKSGNGEAPLHADSARGYIEVVKYLVDEVNIKRNDGCTPLFVA